MKRPIGRTGVDVFAIGLGAMPMSIQGRPAESQSIETVHAALDAGVDFIDTADVYCLDDSEIGHNERLLAKALAQHPARSRVRVATKGGLTRPGGDWENNGRPEHLRQACEKSLGALGVDSIFLYQLHAPDSDVPFEDSVGELARLKSEGKIQHVGLSNVSADELKRALAIVRIETVQNRAHIAAQSDFHNGVVAACEAAFVTYLAYSPVGGGRSHSRLMNQAALTQLAKKYGVSPYQVALAWLLAKSPVVLPIPGASKPRSILDSVQAATLKMSPEDVRSLDEPAR